MPKRLLWRNCKIHKNQINSKINHVNSQLMYLMQFQIVSPKEFDKMVLNSKRVKVKSQESSQN